MSIDEVRDLVRRGGMLRNEEAYVLLDALDAVARERDRLRRIVERVANSPKVDVSGSGSHFDALIPCDIVREALGGGDGR